VKPEIFHRQHHTLFQILPFLLKYILDISIVQKTVPLLTKAPHPHVGVLGNRFVLCNDFTRVPIWIDFICTRFFLRKNLIWLPDAFGIVFLTISLTRNWQPNS